MAKTKTPAPKKTAKTAKPAKPSIKRPAGGLRTKTAVKAGAAARKNNEDA